MMSFSYWSCPIIYDEDTTLPIRNFELKAFALLQLIDFAPWNSKAANCYQGLPDRQNADYSR